MLSTLKNLGSILVSGCPSLRMYVFVCVCVHTHAGVRACGTSRYRPETSCMDQGLPPIIIC